MGASHESLTLPDEVRVPEPGRGEPRTPAPLGLWDAISIVVGIVVGAGIFESPAKVFAQASGPAAALLAWVLGGLLSLAGALCFAELASAFPRSGGEYVYLTRAFGRWAGFLFAWAQLAVIRSGTIASVSYVFADYATPALGLDRGAVVPLAALVIVLLTAVNVLGVNPGRHTQNLLTALKVLALGGIILAGFLGKAPAPAEEAARGAGASFALAMVFVLYAYGGWHEAAYVTAEVRDRRRNVPLALLGGTAIVTVLYVLINAAWLAGFGFEAAGRTGANAAGLLAGTLGPAAGRAMAVLVMLSALGSVNGTIFTGARIYRELGADHALFAPLGVCSARFGTPLRSLVLQAAVSVALVLFAGWLLPAWFPSDKPSDPFEVLVMGTTPVFFLSLLLTGLSLFVFRARAPGFHPPFAVPLYPFVPLLFCGACAYMLVGSVLDAWQKALVGLAALAAGLPLWLISRLRDTDPGSPG
jgi:amino acid transporter